MPAAQRVLLGDVPAGAVLALLQFLYTAQCPLTPSLAPHVQELASRSVIVLGTLHRPVFMVVVEIVS